MKKIILFSLVLISTLTYSQSLLDSLILERVNTYRVKGGLKSVNFDTIIYKASEYHSSYMVNTGIYNHFEDTSGFKFPSDRYFNFDGELDIVKEGYGECLFVWESNYILDNKDQIVTDEMILEHIDKNSNKISERTVLRWATSPPHKDIIEKESNSLEGAIGTSLKKGEVIEAEYLKGTYILPIKLYITYNVKYLR